MSRRLDQVRPTAAKLAKTAPGSPEEARETAWLAQLALWNIASMDAVVLRIVRAAFDAGREQGRKEGKAT